MYCEVKNNLNTWLSDQAAKTKRSDDLINEMYDLQKEAHQILSSIIHPEFSEEFAKILALAWDEELPEAEKIVQFTGLTRKHFLAIEENLKDLEDTLIKEGQDYDGEPY